MALPPWTVEMLRRGLNDVARRASDPETLDKIKKQATEIWQDLPQTAARGIDAVMRSAEVSKETIRRWSRKHTALAVPILNASGVLLHDFGTGVPVADGAIDAGTEMLRGDCMVGPVATERLSRRIQRCLPMGGDYAVAITSNFPAALTAFSMVVEQRPLVVHRSHAVRLPGGLPLPDAFGTLLPVVQEVGTVESAQVSDFDSLDAFCVVLADGGQQPITLMDFGDRDAMQAAVLPVATFASSGIESIPSAEEMLTQGADAVLMPGDGVCGGPSCGLLVGRRDVIDLITSSPVWPALQANEVTQTMMSVTLETVASQADAVPVRALLDTAEENLRARAERMATRLSGSDLIAHCHVAAADAKISEEGRWRFPSRQVRVRHQTQGSQAWQQSLLEETPAVIAEVDDDELVIDLRWIAASDDGKLAEIVGGDLGAAETDNSPQ